MAHDDKLLAAGRLHFEHVASEAVDLVFGEVDHGQAVILKGLQDQRPVGGMVNGVAEHGRPAGVADGAAGGVSELLEEARYCRVQPIGGWASDDADAAQRREKAAAEREAIEERAKKTAEERATTTKGGGFSSVASASRHVAS